MEGKIEIGDTMKKQVNIQLDENIIRQIESVVDSNPSFNTRTHFVELAVIYFLEKKPAKFFKPVGGGL